MVGEAVKACGALHLALFNPEYCGRESDAQDYYARTFAEVNEAREIRLPSTKPRTKQHKETSAVIATINIVYDMMSGTGLGIYTAHALIQECDWHALSPGLAGACFWFNVGMNALTRVMYKSSVAWDPDKWRFVLPQSKLSPQKGRLTAGGWMHSMVHVMAKSVNHYATRPRAQSPGYIGQGELAQRAQTWDDLTHLCDWCKDSTPQTMQPLATLDSGLQGEKSCFPNPG